MRLRGYAYGSGLLVLVAIVAGVALSVFRSRPMGVSVGVHSYRRQGDEVLASLVLTNTGTVSVAAPLQFQCQVDRGSGFTNYVVKTPYSVFLQPRQHVILSNVPWRVRIPADTRAWKVNVLIRRMSGREQFVNAVRESGFLHPRMLSRLAGRPRKEADYEWLECASGVIRNSSRATFRSSDMFNFCSKASSLQGIVSRALRLN